MDVKEDWLSEYRDIIPQCDFVCRKVKVSVYCNAFNHEPYIREALEGFVNQKTDFDYQVFVYDDASTDGTSEIVREYSRKYPDKIMAMIAKRNTYREPFRLDMKSRISQKYLTGDYIATCEGDDCWTDPDKLQTQIDYMEQHPDCVLTCHDAVVIDYRKNERREFSLYDSDRILSAEDVILQKSGTIPHASVVMRREFFFKDSSFPACDVGDWPRRLRAMVHGYIYYFRKPMSVYRYMHDNSWSSIQEGDMQKAMKHRLGMIRFLREYDAYSEYRFSKFLDISINSYLLTNALENNTACTKQEYFEICDGLKDAVDSAGAEYLEKQKQLWSLLHEDEEYRDKGLLDYLAGHGRVVIMGAGRYAGRLTKYLDKQGRKIEGYVVSDNQDAVASWTDAPVWKVKDYPFGWEETGVLVAVHPNYRLEIEQSLAGKGISDYYAPYWVI
ncbi:MAG: glycosyltransferase [Roseburia sp.]|nr:glycosyltransferase [Roseburia sp.]